MTNQTCIDCGTPLSRHAFQCPENPRDMSRSQQVARLEHELQLAHDGRAAAVKLWNEYSDKLKRSEASEDRLRRAVLRLLPELRALTVDRGLPAPTMQRLRAVEDSALEALAAVVAGEMNRPTVTELRHATDELAAAMHRELNREMGAVSAKAVEAW